MLVLRQPDLSDPTVPRRAGRGGFSVLEVMVAANQRAYSSRLLLRNKRVTN